MIAHLLNFFTDRLEPLLKETSLHRKPFNMLTHFIIVLFSTSKISYLFSYLFFYLKPCCLCWKAHQLQVRFVDQVYEINIEKFESEYLILEYNETLGIQRWITYRNCFVFGFWLIVSKSNCPRITSVYVQHFRSVCIRFCFPPLSICLGSRSLANMHIERLCQV